MAKRLDKEKIISRLKHLGKKYYVLEELALKTGNYKYIRDLEPIEAEQKKLYKQLDHIRKRDKR